MVTDTIRAIQGRRRRRTQAETALQCDYASAAVVHGDPTGKSSAEGSAVRLARHERATLASVQTSAEPICCPAASAGMSASAGSRSAPQAVGGRRADRFVRALTDL